MLPAMEAGPQVVNEVLIAIRRLLNASGRNLQQLSWHCILQLLKQALKLCEQVCIVTSRLRGSKTPLKFLPAVGKIIFTALFFGSI